MARSSLFVISMQTKWSKVKTIATVMDNRPGLHKVSTSFEAHTSHLFRPFVQDGIKMGELNNASNPLGARSSL